MEDGIVRVFPTLLHQTFGRALFVLDEAVAIAIAVFINPAQRTLDARPQFLQE